MTLQYGVAAMPLVQILAITTQVLLSHLAAGAAGALIYGSSPGAQQQDHLPWTGHQVAHRTETALGCFCATDCTWLWPLSTCQALQLLPCMHAIAHLSLATSAHFCHRLAAADTLLCVQAP